MTLTPTQQKLYDTIRNLHGGDTGYADSDWKMVEEVIEEAVKDSTVAWKAAAWAAVEAYPHVQAEERAAIIAEVEKMRRWIEPQDSFCDSHIYNKAIRDLLNLIRKRKA